MYSSLYVCLNVHALRAFQRPLPSGDMQLHRVWAPFKSDSSGCRQPRMTSYAARPQQC